MRRTRPGRPWRQGPFVGDSGRGKSPGNPTVTWFPSRSRYGRAAEAPRRGQRSALRTAPLGCPSNTGTRVAFLSSPEVTPLRDWPERPPRHPVPPPSDMDPDTRAEPLPSAGGARGRSGLELGPESPPLPPPPGSGLRPAAPVFQAAPLRPLCARCCARCAALAPQPPALVLPGRGGGAVAPTCSAGSCPGAAAAQRAGTRHRRAGSLGNPGGGSQPPGAPLRDRVPSPSCGDSGA